MGTPFDLLPYTEDQHVSAAIMGHLPFCDCSTCRLRTLLFETYGAHFGCIGRLIDYCDKQMHKTEAEAARLMAETPDLPQIVRDTNSNLKARIDAQHELMKDKRNNYKGQEVSWANIHKDGQCVCYERGLVDNGQRIRYIPGGSHI